MVTADDFERRVGKGRKPEKRTHSGGQGRRNAVLFGGALLAAGVGFAAGNEDVRSAVLDAVRPADRTAPRDPGAGVREGATAARGRDADQIELVRRRIEAGMPGARISPDGQGVITADGFFISNDGRITPMEGTSQAAIEARVLDDRELRESTIERINRDSVQELTQFEITRLRIWRATPRDIASGVPAGVVNYSYPVEGRNDLNHGTGVGTGERRQGFYVDTDYTG